MQRPEWLRKWAPPIVVAFLLALISTNLARAQQKPIIEIIPQIFHTQSITSVAFSANGAYLLSGSRDNTMKLWDAATGRLLRTFGGHSNTISSVAFSPDGSRVLSGSNDNTMKLWDAATGRLLRTFQGHTDRVTSVAFAPDGRRVLTGSNDNTMKLWDAAHLPRS